MDLSLVIVTHNSSSQIENCLESIDAHPPSCEYETIVIDNASADGTPETVRRRFPHVRLVTNSDNRGYSRGVNQGMSLATGGAILVLNPDIILQRGSVDALLEFMRDHPRAGIMGAKLLYPDGRLQHSCRTFYSIKVLLLRRTFLGKLFPNAKTLRDHLMLDYDHETPREVDWIIGACMLVRREALEQVGKMDERFFLYLEDTDWCYRMKHRGWSVHYVPSSVMIHAYERSSARSILRKPFVIHMLSLLRYYEKWNRIFYFLRRHRAALKSILFVLSDLVAINLAFFAAYFLRDWFHPFFTKQLYPLDWYRYFVYFYNLIYFVTFLFSGLYRIRRETVWIEELLRIARAAFLVLAILLAATYISRIRIYSRAVLLGHTIFSILLATGFRQIIRSIHRELVKASFDLKRVLILGSEEEVSRIEKSLTDFPELGIDIVGYIGDGDDSLGKVGELPEVVERFRIQEVIVFPSFHEEESLIPFMVRSRGKMIQVRVISPLARFLGTGVRVEELAGYHTFTIDRGFFFLVWCGFKRIVDVGAALILIPFVSLFSLIYFIFGKITGIITFYRETRLAAAGAPIRWPRAVAASGRESSDLVKIELWFYLLTGRLSLVGPPPAHTAWTMEQTVRDIYRFRPGITGNWRIAHYDDWTNATEDEILQMQSCSPTREIIILARSITLMLRGVYPAWFHNERRNP